MPKLSDNNIPQSIMDVLRKKAKLAEIKEDIDFTKLCTYIIKTMQGDRDESKMR